MWKFRKLFFWDLLASIHKLMILKDTATELTQLVCVDLVSESHMLVLGRSLSESIGAAKNRTCERGLTCVNSDMVLKS